ncbi:MAG: hypothetical protein IJ659_05410 [Alloprevotella sp.]|nr:hypothetical protein [Alloprevotella sp.]
MEKLWTYILMAALLLPALSLRAQQGGRKEAAALMEKVFSYPKRLGLKTSDYEADVYTQFGFRTTRRSRYARYLPQFFRFERGTNDYFGESHLRLSVHENARDDIRELAYFCTHPHAEKLQRTGAVHFLPTIYESKLFADRILSPLNRRNRRYYRYAFASGSADIPPAGTRRIRFAPRFYNTQLVAGYADVDTLSGAVRRYSFSFYYELNRLRTSGTMGTDSLASLLPESFSVASSTAFLGNRLSASFLGTAKYTFPTVRDSAAAVPRRRRFDLTERYALRVDTSHAVRDATYFDTVRTYPLPAGAQTAYKEVVPASPPNPLSKGRGGSLRRGDFRRPTCVSLDEGNLEASPGGGRKEGALGGALEGVLFDRHRWALGEEGQVRLPAILTPEMFAWSKRKGFMLQTRMRLEYAFSPRSSLSLAPKASYSFLLHQFYWRAPLTLRFAPHYDMLLALEAGKGNHVYSSRQADDVRSQMRGTEDFEDLDRMLGAYDFNFYRDLYAHLDYALSPVSGLRLEAGLRYHRRSLVGWNEEARAHGMQRYIRSIAPRLHAEWTPCQYYYRDAVGRKVPLYSRWPTLRLDYERGLPVGRLRSRYERIEADATYAWELYALRALYLRAGGGLYTHRGHGYFLSYDYFCDENLPEGWHDEMSGRFYALGSRWYNESRYYARLSATYESPMLLFSRLKWLSRVVQRERIYANLVSLSALPAYTELGYGIGSHILDVSAFLGLAPGRRTALGAHVVLHW